ncbi:MAG: sigma-70 family RNA polymerase sigma factor [Planctomycetaceae bacterium]|nr:sigma-70 family RNA polymerase sigma factor [Planctomycetaceae bacterium]
MKRTATSRPQENRASARRESNPTEITYVPNSGFASCSRKDLQPPEDGLYRENPPAATAARMNAALVESTLLQGLQQSRLLTHAGEQYLFRRMNFLRYQASQIQAASPAERPSPRRQRQVKQLLAEADELRGELAAANLRLVASISGRFSKSSDEFDEFVAEGNAVLLNAIDCFDFSRGYRFSTYATHAIQRRLYRLTTQRARRSSRESVASDSRFPELPERELDPEILAREERQAVAVRILNRFDETLDDREQAIVRGRFGLDGTGQSKTLRTLADQFGLSKERIRQLLQRAIGKLSEVSGPLASDLAL